MLLATCLDLTGEYGVSKTVTKYPRFRTEAVPKGMIVGANSITERPSINWEAYRYASTAQLNSYRNGHDTGLGQLHYGIYRMITNHTGFMANENDRIGYWSCTRTTEKPITYNQTWKGEAEEIYDYDIWSDLFDRGLLFSYDTKLAASNTSKYDDNDRAVGRAKHTTILTASSYTTGELFEIKAAIDTEDLDDIGSKQMDTFHCLLRSTESTKIVEEVARVIDIEATLFNWKAAIVGSMFPGIYEDHSYNVGQLEINLQWYLNSMIMVAGSHESVTTENTSGYKIGSVKFATIIPYWILGVVVVVFLLAKFLLVLTIYLWFAIRGTRSLYDLTPGPHVTSREITMNTPNGMLEWMAHAAYESRDADQIPKSPQLHDWILSTTWHAERRLGIVRATEHGLVDPVGTPGIAMQSMQYQSMSEGYFPMKKGEYISIESKEVH